MRTTFEYCVLPRRRVHGLTACRNEAHESETDFSKDDKTDTGELETKTHVHNLYLSAFIHVGISMSAYIRVPTCMHAQSGFGTFFPSPHAGNIPKGRLESITIVRMFFGSKLCPHVVLPYRCWLVDPRHMDEPEPEPRWTPSPWGTEEEAPRHMEEPEPEPCWPPSPWATEEEVLPPPVHFPAMVNRPRCR